MNTKLNANELAAKRYAVTSEHTTGEIIAAMTSGQAYAAAIREVAQPLEAEVARLKAELEEAKAEWKFWHRLATAPRNPAAF